MTSDSLAETLRSFLELQKDLPEGRSRLYSTMFIMIK